MPAKKIFRRQRLSWDCGVAVAAMVSSVPYNSVMKLVPREVRGRGLDCEDMVKMLGSLTGRPWRKKNKYRDKPIKGYKYDALSPFIVCTKEGNYHWVAADSSLVYDPSYYGPAPLEYYLYKVAMWVCRA